MMSKHINLRKFSKAEDNNGVNAKIIKNKSVAFTNKFGQDVKNVESKTLFLKPFKSLRGLIKMGRLKFLS